MDILPVFHNSIIGFGTIRMTIVVYAKTNLNNFSFTIGCWLKSS